MKFKRAIIFAVRFPESSGGATYVENLSKSFTSAGISTEVISLYPGNLKSSKVKHITLFKDEKLVRQPIRNFLRGPIYKKIFQALKLLIFKKNETFLARRKIRNLQLSLDELTLLVFTHVRTKTVLESLGLNPKQNGSTVVGQHHSPFISVEEDISLKREIIDTFSDLHYFTALSTADAREFGALINVPSYGIPNPRPEITHQEEVKDWKEREKKAVILARFSEEKRVDLAIKLFVKARQLNESNGWTLEIYGDGILRDKIKQTIIDFNAQSYIHLKGVTDSPLDVLSEARVNLITSRYEGFGMTILEAACVGTPSICFDVSPGVSELSKNLGTVLIESNNNSSYAQSIKKIFSDSPDYAQTSNELIKNSKSYSENTILKKWEHMLE